jgi:hypothetical protein
LAVVLVTVGLAAAAVWGVRQIYFLGSDSGGRLALYRGLPYNLPLDIKLYSEVYAAPVQVSSIPLNRQDSAVNHTLRFHGDAVSLLEDLQRAGERAAQKRQAASSNRHAKARNRNQTAGGSGASKPGAGGSKRGQGGGARGQGGGSAGSGSGTGSAGSGGGGQ